MLNLKYCLCAAALLLMMQRSHAQNKKTAADFLPEKIEEAKKAPDKKLYLQTMLKKWQGIPARYCGAPQNVRDSVCTAVQMDMQALYLSIFPAVKQLEQIKKGTARAETITMQMINEGKFNAEQQEDLDHRVAKTTELIAKTNYW